MGGVKNYAQESEEGSTPHPRNYSLSLKKRACCKIQHTPVVILIDMEMIICGIFTVGGNPKTPRYIGGLIGILIMQKNIYWIIMSRKDL